MYIPAANVTDNGKNASILRPNAMPKLQVGLRLPDQPAKMQPIAVTEKALKLKELVLNVLLLKRKSPAFQTGLFFTYPCQ